MCITPAGQPYGATSPGILSDSNELEEDEHILDTQYLNYVEDTVNQDEGHSDATEEDNETDSEFDAQSLGLNSSHNDDDHYEPAIHVRIKLS